MAPRTPNPLDGFAVDRAALRYVGQGLQRPECILAEPDGSLWVADARGGVMHIRADGAQRLVVQDEVAGFAAAADERTRYTTGTLPNGLAFARNGDLLVSNFGTDRLERMTRDTGRSWVLANTIDGQPVGKANFVLRDSKDRLWLTISTCIQDWMTAVRPDLPDGYVALYEEGRGLRVMADGFRFTNEVQLDAAEEWLYVVETCGPCITRLRVRPDGELTDRHTFGPSNHGAPIDGIAFDAHGNLWGTQVMVDRLFALTPEGELRILLDDAPPRPSDRFMEAFREGRATPELMLACGGTIAPWFASITLGGPDLRTVYVGSLRGTRIPWFCSPVAGLPMAHWTAAG